MGGGGSRLAFRIEVRGRDGLIGGCRVVVPLW